MCEYCGCQSLAAIAELTEEHDQVVNLIGDTRSAYHRGDVGAMIELSQAIAAVLGPHTVVEEQGLFPAMATDFPDQIAVLHDEHRSVEAVLDQAADGTAASDAAWPARLIEVLAMLRMHILKEQDGVFPAALSTLSTAQWAHVDEIREAQHALRNSARPPAAAFAAGPHNGKVRQGLEFLREVVKQ